MAGGPARSELAVVSADGPASDELGSLDSDGVEPELTAWICFGA